MLKKVMVESSCSAKAAEEFINDCIERYQTETIRVGFELKIENATQIGKSSTVYYTVIITLTEIGV